MTERPPSVPARQRRGGVLAPLVGVVVCAVVVWTTYVFFVTTAPGQLADDAAWHGAQFGRRTLSQVVEPVLDVVSVPFLAGTLIAAVLIAVVQRRWSIAVAAVVLLAGANVTTQMLKTGVFERPDLHLTEVHSNSLPSGHTTVAASVAATALLIAPARLRGPIAVIGVALSALMGFATLVTGWHRPSDVVAAFAVAAAWYFLIEAARALAARNPLPRGYRDAPRANAVSLLGLVAAGAGAGAALLLALTLFAVPVESPAGEILAYVGGCLGVLTAATTSMLAMLAMRPHHSSPRA